MIKNLRILPRTIFGRLFVTFLCILIPLVAISVGIQITGMSIIRTEITSSMKSRVDYRKLNLDAELDRMQSYMRDTLSDVDLLKLANAPGILTDFEKVQAMNRVQSRLIAFRNSSIYIEDVQILLNELDRSIKANDGVSPLKESERTLISESTAPDLMRFVKENETLYLRGRNLVLLNRPSMPQFVIQVVFSSESLKSAFTQSDAVPGEGALLYSPDQDFFVTTNQKRPVAQAIRQMIDEDDQITSFDRTMAVDNVQFLIVCTRLESQNIWLAEYVPTGKVFSPLDKYAYLLWVFAVFSMIILVFFSLSIRRIIHRPLHTLVEAFHRVERGELRFSIEHRQNDEFQYLYHRFNAMLESTDRLIDQVYAQKILSQKAELKQLQSQINPHFLFNSLFILQRMVQNDEKENAVKFAGYLGKYFRFVTRNGVDELPLEQEVEHTRNYLEIQAIRFSNAQIEFGELPSEYRDLIVPRLILQPILENAFEYSFFNTSGLQSVAVRFIAEPQGLRIEVEDSGDSSNDEALEIMKRELSSDPQAGQESTGLINVARRIRLKFGAPSSLSVDRGSLGGWLVTIFLSAGTGGECDA